MRHYQLIANSFVELIFLRPLVYSYAIAVHIGVIIDYVKHARSLHCACYFKIQSRSLIKAIRYKFFMPLIPWWRLGLLQDNLLQFDLYPTAI